VKSLSSAPDESLSYDAIIRVLQQVNVLVVPSSEIPHGREICLPSSSVFDVVFRLLLLCPSRIFLARDSLVARLRMFIALEIMGDTKSTLKLKVFLV
jgi:hypothetical protein